MKNIKFILGILLSLSLFFAACDDDEVGKMNISADDFIQVSNRTATMSYDGTYYVLSEYMDPDTIAKYGFTTNVYIVDRKEDAAKIEALGNGVTDVVFGGIGQITDYRPEGTDRKKAHYMIMLTSISSNEAK